VRSRPSGSSPTKMIKELTTHALHRGDPLLSPRRAKAAPGTADHVLESIEETSRGRVDAVRACRDGPVRRAVHREGHRLDRERPPITSRKKSRTGSRRSRKAMGRQGPKAARRGKLAAAKSRAPADPLKKHQRPRPNGACGASVPAGQLGGSSVPPDPTRGEVSRPRACGPRPRWWVGVDPGPGEQFLACP